MTYPHACKGTTLLYYALFRGQSPVTGIATTRRVGLAKILDGFAQCDQRVAKKALRGRLCKLGCYSLPATNSHRGQAHNPFDCAGGTGKLRERNLVNAHMNSSEVEVRLLKT